MNIAILLPLTENYSKNIAGAASLAAHDNCNHSIYKFTIFGFTKSKNILSKHYRNLNFKKKFFFSSKNKSYLDFFIKKIDIDKYSILEVYNRPEFVHYLRKKTNIKIILHIINDPLKLRGSKSFSDRKNLLNICEIIFISKWVQKQFFTDFSKIKKTAVIPPGSPKPKTFPKKKKIIIFAGKTNLSKGFDIFCHAVISILKKFPDWSSIIIGDDPREKFNFSHPRLFFKGWVSYKKTLSKFSEASICVIPSRWEEPFGRVSLESSAYGCANIVSKKGGLPETCKYKITLKNLTFDNLSKELEKLIMHPKKLALLQRRSFNSHKHTPQKSVLMLDTVRKKISND
tara:strand:- start:379 stop:1407 length:1029 start_codon:yes stop_codon:yes gene_type:complete